MYRDEESIKKYGEYPAEPIEDGRFSDKNAMSDYAKTKIQPDPALSLEVTTYSNFKPVAGDMIHIMVKQQSICTNEAVVGFNWYPYSATNSTSVTLNSNSQNILDYQHSRQVALTDAINSVRQDTQKSIEASSQANQIGGDKKLFTWLKEYAGWLMMDIWDWIDYLARGLKKAADQSQKNYQQVHAYIDGHDKETLNQMKEIVYDSVKLKSPDGTIYKITIDNSGVIIKRKVGD